MLVVQVGRAVGQPPAERVQVEALERAVRRACDDRRRQLPAAGLADRQGAAGRPAPAARPCAGAWSVAEPFLEQAQDDATRLAVQDMERAGVETVTDGEMRRESYSNRFATALDGVDLDNPGVAIDRTATRTPSRASSIRRTGPVEIRTSSSSAASPSAGSRSRCQPVHDDPAGAGRLLRRRAEPRPGLRRAERGAARPQGRRRGRRPDRRAVPPGPAEPARAYALEAINRARRGRGRDRVHTCFGYAHIVKDCPATCSCAS